MNIIQEKFGMYNDVPIDLYTISNDNGASVSITNYGAIITSIKIPDRYGQITDVVLGYDSLTDYINDSIYIGSLVGRYANRIKEGKFQIGEKKYQLTCNQPGLHLHGGDVGFNKKVWGKAIEGGRGSGLELSLTSPDGEEGFPGNLEVTVRYIFTPESELIIEYQAETDRPTIVNLTQHSYFNLGGHGAIIDHHLQINSSHYTPVASDLIPTGVLASVEGSPFDFRKQRPISEAMSEEDQQKPKGDGFDHNYVLDTKGRLETLAASVYHPPSGRTMEIYTTKPGMQLYTGNYLTDQLKGRGSVSFGKHGALCLETQHYPDSPNKPTFPSPILMADQKYLHTSIYRFGLRS